MKRRLNINESVALAFVVLFVVLGLFAPWIAPYDPDAVDLLYRNSPPSRAHWLGTDVLGRDMLSRLIYGARVSLLVGFISVLWSLLFGVPLGLLAGYRGGRFDLVSMRAMDILLSMPRIVLAIFAVTVLGPGLINMTIAIGIWNIPVFARLVRGDALAIREKDFITSAHAVGVSPLRVMFVHILPNCLNSIVITATLLISTAILVEAGLSFLGLGLPPGTPSWGAMINEGRNHIWTEPRLSIIPGIAITLLVLSFNILGDSLRDRLDPRKSSVRGKL
ncbi:MAG: ABC transporter permease [Spirochaetales bacterium]|nr:ABC transporter permease [Spirochaetales bacterium]